MRALDIHTHFEYTHFVEFVEWPAFTRKVVDQLDDESYRAFQNWLMANPEAGDVIEGTGGLRKVRWSDEGRGKGKRGGIRVLYMFVESHDELWLMTFFGKNDQVDLSPDQKKQIRAAIKTELAVRKAERSEDAVPGKAKPKQKKGK